MQQRIPRTEVEQVHSLVYGVVKEVLAVDGLPDADRLHCRVTGSYIRGKPMTGCAPDFLTSRQQFNNHCVCLLARFLDGWPARHILQHVVGDRRGHKP